MEMLKTRTEQYQERLHNMGYSMALSYGLSIVIFNTNSYDDPMKMSEEKLIQEIEYASNFLKKELDKQLERVKR